MSFVAGQPRPGLGQTGALVPMQLHQGGRELVAAGGDSRGKQLMTSVGRQSLTIDYKYVFIIYGLTFCDVRITTFETHLS